MFLDLIDEGRNKEFAEREFGKVSNFKVLEKKNGGKFYNFTFRLEGGVYEEAYFYDYSIYPIGVRSLTEESDIKALNHRYRRFILDELPYEHKEHYVSEYLYKMEKSEVNENF